MKRLLIQSAAALVLAILIAGGSGLWGYQIGRLAEPFEPAPEWRPTVLVGRVIGVQTWFDCDGSVCSRTARMSMLMLDTKGQQAWTEVPPAWVEAVNPGPGDLCDLTRWECVKIGEQQ